MDSKTKMEEIYRKMPPELRSWLKELSSEICTSISEAEQGLKEEDGQLANQEGSNPSTNDEYQRGVSEGIKMMFNAMNDILSTNNINKASFDYIKDRLTTNDMNMQLMTGLGFVNGANYLMETVEKRMKEQGYHLDDSTAPE